MRKILLSILCFYCLQLQAQSLFLPDTSPESAGFSDEKLKDIDNYFNELLTKDQLAGISAIIARDNKIIYNKQFGLSDRDQKTAIMPNTIFRIKSMSKPITSVAAMILIEEGKMALEDDISMYLPEYKNLQMAIPNKVVQGEIPPFDLIPCNEPIRVKHLLTHTSGLIYAMVAPNYLKTTWETGEYQNFENIAAQSKAIAKLPLIAFPGKVWVYSISTDILGRLVEAVSQKPYDVFLKERIFDPLDMNDTGFNVEDADLNRLATLYIPNAGGTLDKVTNVKQIGEGLFPDYSFYQGGKRTMFTGGEGMVSTMEDYLKFCTMLLNGGVLGDNRILKPETVALMTKDHVGELNNALVQGYGFGLGFAVHLNPEKSKYRSSIGEYYWGGAFSTSFWIDPKQQLIGLMMTQVTPYNYLSLGRKYKEMVYDALKK